MNTQAKHKHTSFIAIIKKHPCIYGFVFAFIILIATPLIIWGAYYIGDCGHILINTSLSVGSALGFYGTMLSFLGTTFLGLVAYKQNKYHNKIETDLENANILTPFLAIYSATASPKSHSKKQVKPRKAKSTTNISKSASFEKSHYVIHGKSANIQIENIGQGLATHVFYKHWFGKLLNPEDKQMDLNLPIHSRLEIHIRALDKDIDKTKQIIIYYQNIIGFHYQQVLKYKLVSMPKQVDNDEWEEEYLLYVYLLGEQHRIGMYQTIPQDNSDW